MDAGSSNSRLIRGLELVGNRNAIRARAPIAKPGNEHERVRDVVRFVQPEQEAMGSVDLDC